MYVHLLSQGLVAKHGPCSFRTNLSEEVKFPILSRNDDDNRSSSITYHQRNAHSTTTYADMEVALVSWQYFGQKYASSASLSSLWMELQKVTIRRAELVYTFNKDDVLYVEINNVKRFIANADYTWRQLVNTVVEAINISCKDLKLPTRAKVQQATDAHLPASDENVIEGIQFKSLSGDNTIRFSENIVTILSIGGLFLSGSIVARGVHDVNCFFTIKNTTTSYTRIIDDIIIFPRGCVITSNNPHQPRFEIVAGMWSLSSFQRVIQAYFSDTFVLRREGIWRDKSRMNERAYIAQLVVYQSGEAKGRAGDPKAMYFNEELCRLFRIREANASTSQTYADGSNLLNEWRLYLYVPMTVDYSPKIMVQLDSDTYNKANASYSDFLLSLTNLVSRSATNGLQFLRFYVFDKTDKPYITHCATTDGTRWIIRPSPDLSEMLGFRPTGDGWLMFGAYQPDDFQNLPRHHMEGNLTINQDYIPVPDIGKIPNFWIFTDIIRDQLVAGSKLPLLRVLPNNAPEENKFWVETCDPYYLPVNKSRISSITVTVTAGPNAMDTPIDLAHPVILVLHFRPVTP